MHCANGDFPFATLVVPGAIGDNPTGSGDIKVGGSGSTGGGHHH